MCTGEGIAGQAHRWYQSFHRDNTHRREQMCTIFTHSQWELLGEPMAHTLLLQLFVQHPAQGAPQLHRLCGHPCKQTQLQKGLCVCHIKLYRESPLQIAATSRFMLTRSSMGRVTCHPYSYCHTRNTRQQRQDFQT